MTRVAMWVLLSVVAGAAAVLSFSALRDLALLCGFSASLAWLLPLVVDAGAAAGCLVWLSSNSHGGSLKTHRSACGFSRTLTWLLLASSVCGNAVTHYLTAYHLQPVWWLVVLVSAIAPAVLGAVVHLSVLVGRPHPPVELHTGVDESVDETDVTAFWSDAPYADTPGGRAAELLEQGAGRRRLAKELNVSEYEARKLLRARDGVAR